MPKKLIKERVTKLLEMTGLSGLEKRYPNQLPEDSVREWHCKGAGAESTGAFTG